MKLAEALQSYTDTVLGSITALGPVVAVALVLILVTFGVMRVGR